jgi:hypothetical protein
VTCCVAQRDRAGDDVAWDIAEDEATACVPISTTARASRTPSRSPPGTSHRGSPTAGSFYFDNELAQLAVSTPAISPAARTTPRATR